MRRLALLLCLLAPGIAVRGDGADSDAVIKRAIDAAGGADALAKFPGARLTASGTLFADDKTQIAVTAEQVHQTPGRSRTTMKLEVKGQKLEVLHIVNGTRTKYVINGSPIPITEPAAKELQAAMLTLEIGQLQPLLTDRKFVVKPDRTPKADPALANLTVTVKNGGEFHLGFDRTTGHLVKLARKAFDPSTGKDVDQEQVFSDFKAFGGLARPTKVVLYKNGQKTLELKTDKLTPLETVEAKEFATE